MTPEERIEKIKRLVCDVQEDDLLKDEPVLGAVLTELDNLKAELKAPAGREGE